MYGASKYSHCPKAERKQANVKRYKLRRKQATWSRTKKRMDRKIKKAIRRRDKALLRCERIERRKSNRKAWWAKGQARRAERQERRAERRAPSSDAGYDPYDTEIYDVESQGMVNGNGMEMYGDEEESYSSGMGAAGEGDYMKLIGGLVGLSLFIGVGVYVNNKMQEAQA